MFDFIVKKINGSFQDKLTTRMKHCNTKNLTITCLRSSKWRNMRMKESNPTLSSAQTTRMWLLDLIGWNSLSIWVCLMRSGAVFFQMAEKVHLSKPCIQISVSILACFLATSSQRAAHTFSNIHYAGIVEYTPSLWLDKNKDQLPIVQTFTFGRNGYRSLPRKTALEELGLI